ncbi:hypothetical protein Fmac_030830 [Flemingia macrophylla]|uniref:LIM zinc-binding domain-containing protein n=1 Tax=Flemingia macrophylla TaxID=520843 RepID=A0ABD1L0A3_9FABA
MDWCDHCCRFCQTRVENMIDDFSPIYCSCCTRCGKILFDINSKSRGIKKRRKDNAKIVNKIDAASKGPLMKEVEQLTNSDTIQVSD